MVQLKLGPTQEKLLAENSTNFQFVQTQIRTVNEHHLNYIRIKMRKEWLQMWNTFKDLLLLRRLKQNQKDCNVHHQNCIHSHNTPNSKKLDLHKFIDCFLMFYIKQKTFLSQTIKRLFISFHIKSNNKFVKTLQMIFVSCTQLKIHDRKLASIGVSKLQLQYKGILQRRMKTYSKGDILISIIIEQCIQKNRVVELKKLFDQKERTILIRFAQGINIQLFIKFFRRFSFFTIIISSICFQTLITTQEVIKNFLFVPTIAKCLIIELKANIQYIQSKIIMLIIVKNNHQLRKVQFSDMLQQLSSIYSKKIKSVIMSLKNSKKSIIIIIPNFKAFVNKLRICYNLGMRAKDNQQLIIQFEFKISFQLPFNLMFIIIVLQILGCAQTHQNFCQASTQELIINHPIPLIKLDISKLSILKIQSFQSLLQGSVDGFDKLIKGFLFLQLKLIKKNSVELYFSCIRKNQRIVYRLSQQNVENYKARNREAIAQNSL
ncbi:unnamed protein product [Paramecium octaurelia]|uniref:Uncharacterized protein n=1 Tax=Paramecium octaurelia TaxID=43137 RepID=A0A8S1RYP7_PAROT|nr:unnamed protein product [Paramecium octaurelia]